MNFGFSQQSYFSIWLRVLIGWLEVAQANSSYAKGRYSERMNKSYKQTHICSQITP
ncbi:hypothetical protein [Algisphaera agarilytica]|uniref:Uncharacterized protein n=1 Tax=Algisphaera agarilytica TaxID=1385975 RepID=A0A7X0H8S5_9BACT|nr:hypothetical protein [Algisphaera agarilytica]MBB6431363.1 hypothetical protein [Algisphaera agarilytica]